MTTKCATHPDVETNLRCGKCGKLICPKCLVQTPVGARCRECAQLRRLPIYELSGLQYLRAVAIGLVLAFVSGMLWAFIPLRGYFSLLIALGVGYGIGELMSLSVNRKRGLGLQAIAAISMVLSYLTKSIASNIPFFGFADIFGLIALILGVSIAVNILR